MDLNSVYTEIITEHNAHARNRHHIDCPTCDVKGHNPSCGDEITLELRVKDGVIEDASFVGTGCAISQASADIMVDLIRGKKVEDAKRLANHFLGMIKGEPLDDAAMEELDEALALQNIAKMPARVKCAVLGWHTLENALENGKDTKD